jgi:hypothetical protein
MQSLNDITRDVFDFFLNMNDMRWMKVPARRCLGPTLAGKRNTLTRTHEADLSHHSPANAILRGCDLMAHVQGICEGRWRVVERLNHI